MKLVDAVISSMKKSKAANKHAFADKDFEVVRAAMLMWTEATAPQKSRIYGQTTGSIYKTSDEDKNSINPEMVFWSSTNIYAARNQVIKAATEFLSVDKNGRSAHEITLFQPSHTSKTEIRTMRMITNNAIRAASDSMDANVLNPFHRYTDSFTPNNLHFLHQISDQLYETLEKMNNQEFAAIGTMASLIAILAVRQTAISYKADLPPTPQPLLIAANVPLNIPIRYRTQKTAISVSEYLRLLELSTLARIPMPNGIKVLEEENPRRSTTNNRRS